MAALVCGLTLGLTSCKPNEDDLNPEEKAHKEAEKLNKFWDIASQLVNPLSYTTDYAEKTFEPTIGEPSTGDPQTRIVATNSAAAAAQRFAQLVCVEKGIDENTKTYTYDDPDVGTLVYNKVSDGTAWATVDVNIKQIPHLTKIIYRSPDQGDTNGSFKGRAYYRFGDVIARTVTAASGQQVDEYWVCVRPSFGPEDKGESHWMTTSPLPEDNVWSYKGSNGTTYRVPTGLGTNKEQMQNFAEMVYAICFPRAWSDSIDKYSTESFWGPGGLPIFHDFHKSKKQYHNIYFWQRVQDAWKKKGITNALFGKDFDQIAKMVSADRNRNDGLNFLYSGYSWNTWTTNGPTLYVANYKNGAKEKGNMHVESLLKVQKDVIDKKNPSNNLTFDITTLCTGISPEIVHQKFFGNMDPHYVVRFAKGSDLLTVGSYEVRSPISNNGQFREVYNYNKENNIVDLLGDPEISDPITVVPDNPNDPNYVSNAPEKGVAGTYLPGDVVKDQNGNRWICLNGSPHSPMSPSISDNRATFVTFDFNGIDTSGKTIPGLIKEDNLVLEGYLFAEGVENLFQQMTDYQMEKNRDGKLGKIGQHILDYAGVDMRKIFAPHDSTWHFQDQKTMSYYDSKSVSEGFSFAYDDGQTGRQAICRFIYDATQSGSHRDKCFGKNKDGEYVHFQDMYFRFYKYYETYDPSRMTLKPEEQSVGMTLWHTLWAKSNDKMALQDVTSNDLVSRYAARDKWVRLPWSGSAQRQQPRTTVETSAMPADFLWQNGGFRTQKTNMFNEPVLFFRLMYVEDDGGKVPNLVSTDGRQLTVVHMQNDAYLYNMFAQASWCLLSDAVRQNCTTFDNQQVVVPSPTGFVR